MDHLIPISNGGADTDANLWPQPSIEHHAEAKDKLEYRLRARASSIS